MDIGDHASPLLEASRLEKFFWQSIKPTELTSLLGKLGSANTDENRRKPCKQRTGNIDYKIPRLDPNIPSWLTRAGIMNQPRPHDAVFGPVPLKDSLGR
jgi:hypothetical protein